jgi:hypothetical protein
VGNKINDMILVSRAKVAIHDILRSFRKQIKRRPKKRFVFNSILEISST